MVVLVVNKGLDEVVVLVVRGITGSTTPTIMSKIGSSSPILLLSGVSRIAVKLVQHPLIPEHVAQKLQLYKQNKV